MIATTVRYVCMGAIGGIMAARYGVWTWELWTVLMLAAAILKARDA